MPTKIVREAKHVDALAALIGGLKFPITVTWSQGAPRTNAQNRLSQQWYTDISRQMGDRSHEEARAQCKLMFGVPILRAENEAFRVSYDRTMKHLTFEEKVEAIMAFDLPVTRLMKVKQMIAFMDALHRYWSPQVRLTDPEAFKYEQEFQ